MLDEKFFIIQTWNGLLAKYEKVRILKKIGRHVIHANRCFGFLPKDVQEDLTREYRRTKFAHDAYILKKVA
jgi:hypothetical protein